MSGHSQRSVWRQAEANLGHPRAFQRAVSRLPPRQGLILSAMAALEDGRRDQLEPMADQLRTVYPALAAVIDLLLMPASSIHPSNVRRKARRAGIENPAALPMLDLIRALAVARRQETAPPSPALRAAKKGRPALAAVVVALTSRADRVVYQKAVRRWSPRAEQVILTARASRLGWVVDDDWLAETFDPLLLHLPKKRWPDLYEDGPATQLKERIEGSAPWSPYHDDASSWLWHRPAAEQRRWLGAILARLVRDIPAGRLHRLDSAAHLAAHLAENLPGMQDLARQLFALDLRLWAAQGPADPPARILEILWRERRAALPTAALLDLARRLVDAVETSRDAYDPNAIRGAVACIVANSDDLADVKDLTLAWLDEVSPVALRRDLAAEGASPARQELVLGLAAIADGRIEETMRAAMVLTRALGRLDEAAFIAITLARRLAQRRRPPARTIRAIRKFLDAIAATRLVDDALYRVVDLAVEIGQVPEPLKVQIEAFVDAVGSSAHQRARAVAMAMAIGRQDLAGRAVAGMGRLLRRQAQEDANAQCLAVICEVLGLAMCPNLDAVLKVLRPLHAWLLRDGPAPALDAARRLPKTGVFPVGLFTWYLQYHQVLGRDPWWMRQLVEVLASLARTAAIADSDPHLLTRLMTEILDAGPTTPVEMLKRLDRRMEILKFLDGPSSFRAPFPF